ncbi:MAG: sugar ABC transporter substrate-binding protein [Emergencia sp.]
MKRSLMKAVSLLLIASMVLFSFTACGSKDEGDGGADAAAGHKVSGNILGQGVNALDIIEQECKYVQESIGNSWTVYNDNFSADTHASNIQTMAQEGTDGMMIFGFVPTLYTKISEICQGASIPFVFFDQIPSDEKVLSTLNENEYYVGSVGTDNYAAGANVAKKMLENGIKTAFTLGGAVGDVVHDARLAGFKDAFTEGGGKLVAEGHCDSPADATTKGDDLIAANKVDGIYALTGDYAIGVLTALSNHGADIPVYCSDTTAEAIEKIKSGEIAYGDGGSKIATTLAGLLLDNYMDGNIIKDSEGKAPYFGTIVPFEITADNADQYAELFLTGHPMTADAMSELTGEGVTYDTFVQFIENYSFESLTK